MNGGAGSDETAVLAAVHAGDAAAFAALSERYRRQLRVHCYRMLGSAVEAEDLVQETLLRAWRGRESFEGRSSFKTWLYRIATNACLNALERVEPRILPQDVVAPVTAASDPAGARAEPPWAPELPWLEPYPDHLLEPVAPDRPDAAVAGRETIALAYLAALQHLPPRQRAMLILCDALDWSAQETADLLETSVPAVNSGLQRARATMQARPAADEPATPTEAERALLHSFIAAWERADATALVALMRDDVRWSMPPARLWFDGRAAVAKLFALYPIDHRGDVRMIATGANRQPAAAGYLRPHGQAEFRLVSLNLLRIAGGAIAEVTTFSPSLLRAFDLPPTI